MKMKVNNNEIDRLALVIAKKHGVLPYNMCWDIAHTVWYDGYRCEQTATQTGTDDENISAAPGMRADKFTWPNQRRD